MKKIMKLLSFSWLMLIFVTFFGQKFLYATPEKRYSTVQILHENGSRMFEILDSCKEMKGVLSVGNRADAFNDETSNAVIKIYQYAPRLFDRLPSSCLGKCEAGYRPVILTVQPDEGLSFLSCVKVAIENQ